MLIQTDDSLARVVDRGLTHRTEVPPDDGEPITFKWHFQCGILKPRMSGYELASFILTQMPYILPFFANHPRVYAEFHAILTLLATTPKQALDRLLPWIRCVYHEEADDIIQLSLFDTTPQPATTLYFT